MIDNTDLNSILDILEKYEDIDEAHAIKLLREFNVASKELGKLLLNLDKSLSHEEWKGLCDEAQKRLDSVVSTIKNLDC